MRDTDYAYCVARVRAAESKMLTKEDVQRLENFSSLDDAMKFLKEKSFASSECVSISDVSAFQKENLWTLLSESVPDKKELDVLCILNDYFNIKAAVKCLLSGVSPEKFILKPTTVNVESLRENLLKRDFYASFREKGELARMAYDSAVKTESGQRAEIIIDRAAIDAMAEFSRNSNDKVTSSICAFLSDTSNIRIAYRCIFTDKDESFISEAVGECRKFSREKLISASLNGVQSLDAFLETTVYAECVKAIKDGFSSFEKWCDEKLVEIASKSIYTSFSFAPVCSYYYKKLTEIKRVNVILSGISVRDESVGDADV